MEGYGYQWRMSRSCCTAQAIDAGQLAAAGCCPDISWFWVVGALVLGVAIFAPVKKGGF